MSFNGIRVSFACRLCSNSFNQVSDFLAHKKEKHFQEFQQTTCIVFEEKPSLNFNHGHVEPEPSLPSSTVFVKLETFDDASLNEPEPEPESQVGGSSSSRDLYQIKVKRKRNQNETPFKHKIQPQPQYKNPFVLLKQINRREIQNFTKENSCRDSDERISIDDVINSGKLPYPPGVTPPISDTTDALICRLFSKNFSSDPQLRIHVQICLLYNNNEANLTYCPKCNDFFPNSKQLQDHIDFFHAHKILADKIIPTITFVSKSFRNNSKNSNLLPIISCLEQNPTKACDRLLEGVNNQHERFTVNKPDLTCKNFEQNINQSHSLKSFNCSFPNCENTFKSKWNLEQHARRHTGARPFKCQVPNCGKAFTNPGTWYNHKMTHSMSYEFKCPFAGCEQAFKVKRDMARHFKAVHA